MFPKKETPSKKFYCRESSFCILSNPPNFISKMLLGSLRLTMKKLQFSDCFCWRHSSTGKKSIRNMMIETKTETETLEFLNRCLKKIKWAISASPPPKCVFSLTVSHIAMKLCTSIQVLNTNTSVKFQVQPHIITPLSLTCVDFRVNS